MRVLYPEAPYSFHPDESDEGREAYDNVRRSAHHREDIQEQRRAYGRKEQDPVVAQKKSPAAPVLADREETVQDLRRQTEVLRNRRIVL